MTRLLLATRNKHKVREIGEMMAGIPLRLTTYDEFPGIPEAVEDGKTLEENASKKALHAARLSGLWALADDTGLEVEALGGAPGVHSARYAGPDCDYDDNNRMLLENLRGVPRRQRKAAFRTVVALASPDGGATLEEGRVEGLILEGPRGRNGFGYDPIFYLPARRKTLAELSPSEKNALSHRALALAKIRNHLVRVGIRASAQSAGNGSERKAAVCPMCGIEMAAWHCRELCPSCGYQIDCSDPF